jgi:hypothetical protein
MSTAEELLRLQGERDTARNRVAALEKNGAELLARAEQAEARRDAADALLDTALNIRMYGERAPGGNENWRDWEQAASALLYPEPPGGES